MSKAPPAYREQQVHAEQDLGAFVGVITIWFRVGRFKSMYMFMSHVLSSLSFPFSFLLLPFGIWKCLSLSCKPPAFSFLSFFCTHDRSHSLVSLGVTDNSIGSIKGAGILHIIPSFPGLCPCSCWLYTASL